MCVRRDGTGRGDNYTTTPKLTLLNLEARKILLNAEVKKKKRRKKKMEKKEEEEEEKEGQRHKAMDCSKIYGEKKVCLK